MELLRAENALPESCVNRQRSNVASMWNVDCERTPSPAAFEKSQSLAVNVSCPVLDVRETSAAECAGQQSTCSSETWNPHPWEIAGPWLPEPSNQAVLPLPSRTSLNCVRSWSKSGLLRSKAGA